jgi:hypothetical protein
LITPCWQQQQQQQQQQQTLLFINTVLDKL